MMLHLAASATTITPPSAEMDLIRAAFEVLTFRAGANSAVVLLGTMLLGLACGITGSFLLLRRRALVADALSHAALPGVALGYIVITLLGGDGKSLFYLLPAAAVFGVLGVITLQIINTLPRVKEDAAIGSVLSVFFALGIVLLGIANRLASGEPAGLNRFIFGQAASMQINEVWVILALGGIAALIPILFYKELRLLCFDAGFARSLGWSTLALDGALLAVVTMLTVAGLHAVGAILMVALLIIPPAAARCWTDRLWKMVIIAGVFGAVGSALGVTASAVIDDVPTGPAIVLGCAILFIISLLLAPRRGLVARWIDNRRSVARMRLDLARGAMR